ncbi:MAG TPA: ABC transporter ATP-binding protein [Gemmatales bacterium]|nr:ABC transporter ATP-binding protein [Gemmatales bacterium]HMP60296.1 ABC transporter ATP-binding protein [Gemmatales bacterium]
MSSPAEPTTPIMIDLAGVSKSYGQKLAVNNISLQVHEGELFAFLGPNGAGKTTTIKMLCGMLRADRGTVKVGGYDIMSQGDQARQIISYVPDQPHLYEKLTGREFMEFIIAMYGMDRADGHARMEELIRLFELESFVDDLTESYSHGMRQRTVFASALLHQPRVLIVDEPMVGLDPKNQRLVKDLLRKEVARGTTVFMSIHTLDIAQELATRIGIIDRGRLVGVGTLEKLRQQAGHEGPLEDVFLKLTTEGSTLAEDAA